MIVEYLILQVYGTYGTTLLTIIRLLPLALGYSVAFIADMFLHLYSLDMRMGLYVIKRLRQLASRDDNIFSYRIFCALFIFRLYIF